MIFAADSQGVVSATRPRFAALVCLLLAGLLVSPRCVRAEPPPPFQLEIHNGGMTQGGDMPAFWNGKFGDVTAARDTKEFKNKPASLRVTIAGGKNGSAFQTLGGGANAKFKLAGWFKTAGNIRAQVMVQAFSDGYKQNQFFQVQYSQGDSDWTEFSKEITLPAWTAFFNVGIYAEGDGKAWLDEVHEAGKPVDAGKADDGLTTAAPEKDKPNVPGWGFYGQFPQAWQNMHNGYLARTRQGNINIVFLGDSITQGWGGDGKEIWAKRYEPLGAVNYGIGGDSTRQVLWRIGHGEVDGIHPKLVVLKIGTNNLYSDFNSGSDEEIADGITAIVTTLRKKLPETKILLLGLLPRQNDYFSNRVIHINRIIGRLDDGKTIRFLDMGPKFLNAPGKVKPELFNADQLHLVAAGYQVWADTMQPLFAAMLGKDGVPVKKASAGEHWLAMPMLSAAQQAAGIAPGGEGCQYPQTIAIDSTDGSFILFGTDVGGIYRSTNGGKTFSPCDMGYSAVGSCGFAIDPKNPSRCLSIGDNTGGDYYEYDGVYLSTDRGANWKHVLPKLNRGNEKGRDQVAYDASSFDAAKGYCTVAYWAEEGSGKEPGGRLYKTTDGGETWAEIANGAAYGGGKLSTLLKVNPKSGAVYLANDSGFYISADGGASFKQMLGANFTSLDITAGQPDTVLLGTEKLLMRSTDAGKTFAPLQSTGTEAFSRVHVSPADPKRMVCQNPKNGERYFSTDGGLHWTQSSKKLEMGFFPTDIQYNDRARLAVWHPTNPQILWGIGPGDFITQSPDGGKTFQWANNGNNGIMTGGLINFNAQNPNLLYCGSQDYNGALTTNGGKTWEFVNLSRDNRHAKRGDDGDAWGWVYGGYAASDKILYGGNRAYTEDNYNLWITYDGGKTTQQKVANLTGEQVSNGDPTDADVLFCWAYRSADKGQTWTKMNDCDGVFTTYVRAGKSELYGSKGKNIVRSRDKGATWETIATLPHNVRDIGYDAKRDRLFVPDSDNRLQECDGPDYKPTDIADRLPRDQHGDGMAVSTIAVDPVDTNVIYAGANGTGLYYQHSNGVSRSTDGGKTWERLTCNPDFCLNGVTGGQMASAIRVHPVTRYLYVGTDCYGMWRIAPPTPAKSASAK